MHGSWFFLKRKKFCLVCLWVSDVDLNKNLNPADFKRFYLLLVRLNWIIGSVAHWWRYALLFNTDLTCTVLWMYCRICSVHAEFLYLDLTLADPRAAICPPACQERSYCSKHCPCWHQRVTALRGRVPPFNLPAVWGETIQFTKTQKWNTCFWELCLWIVRGV